jgi:hypothetical protein
LPDVTVIERRNMNVWEDQAARTAVVNSGRRRLLDSGLLTEACVSFPVLSALAEGYEVFVVADICRGLTKASHDLALRRMEAAGARVTSWIQGLLELQRDEAAKFLVEVPAIFLEHLNPTQATAYRLADNKLTDRSTWDDVKVATQLKELSELALDFDIEATGFEPPDIDFRIQSLDELDAAETALGPRVLCRRGAQEARLDANVG